MIPHCGSPEYPAYMVKIYNDLANAESDKDKARALLALYEENLQYHRDCLLRQQDLLDQSRKKHWSPSDRRPIVQSLYNCLDRVHTAQEAMNTLRPKARKEAKQS